MRPTAIDVLPNLGFHVLESDQFRSARGNESLIEIARITIDSQTFVIRISIELRVLAMIEVWSTSDLRWNEVHAVPGPIVQPSIDENLEMLARVGIEILRG